MTPKFGLGAMWNRGKDGSRPEVIESVPRPQPQPIDEMEVPIGVPPGSLLALLGVQEVQLPLWNRQLAFDLDRIMRRNPVYRHVKPTRGPFLAAVLATLAGAMFASLLDPVVLPQGQAEAAPVEGTQTQTQTQIQPELVRPAKKAPPKILEPGPGKEGDEPEEEETEEVHQFLEVFRNLEKERMMPIVVLILSEAFGGVENRYVGE